MVKLSLSFSSDMVLSLNKWKCYEAISVSRISWLSAEVQLADAKTFLMFECAFYKSLKYAH